MPLLKIKDKEIMAEKVTPENLERAKSFDSSAEVGDYCITLPDRTLGIIAGKLFETLTWQ